MWMDVSAVIARWDEYELRLERIERKMYDDQGKYVKSEYDYKDVLYINWKPYNWDPYEIREDDKWRIYLDGKQYSLWYQTWSHRNWEELVKIDKQEFIKRLQESPGDIVILWADISV